MRLAVIIPDGLALGHFATDALEREMTDWEIRGPVDVEELIKGSEFELDALKEDGDPDLVLIWHWGETAAAPWVEPLVRFLKEHTPKAYLAWIMFGVGDKDELEAVDKPEEGSFVIDYFDPGDWLKRYLRNIKDRGEIVGREERLVGAIFKPGNNFDALIYCLRSIAG